MYKTIQRTLILTLVLLFLFTATAFAKEVRFSGRTNVRSGPGLDYHILGDVSKGSTLTYTGSTEYDDRGVAWYSVDYKGGGWVSSKYASLGGGSSSSGSSGYGGGSYSSGGSRSGSSGSGSEPESSVDGEVYQDWILYTIQPALRAGQYRRARATSDANLRSGPGLKYTIVNRMNKGESYFCNEEYAYDNRGVVWYQVHDHGQDGWISSKMVVLETVNH